MQTGHVDKRSNRTSEISLAMWLQNGRAAKGMSLDDVARVTKIQARILERLETGKLDGLPAEVFVRGFVRSFARCVGLDEDEALRRYSAASPKAPVGTSAARAMVEAMGDLAPNARAGARPKLERPEVMPSGSLEMPEMPAGSLEMPSVDVDVDVNDAMSLPPLAAPEIVAEASDASPIAEAPVETIDAAAVMIAPPPAIDLTASEAPAPVEKKKRTRKAAEGGKRKRSAIANGTPAEPTPVIAGAAQETAPVAAPKRRRKAKGTEAPPVETTTPAPIAPIENAAIENAAVVEAAVADAAPTITEVDPVVATPLDVDAKDPDLWVADLWASEMGGTPLSHHRTEDHVDDPVETTQFDRPDVIDAVEVELIEHSEGTWTPKMPPITTSMSAPWRRPSYAAAPALVAVIDDADPDSAERALEDRRGKEARRTFLPPILLDREGDRSARQGGLTLAVIILLIAATLTLSYLMRRPSSSGDGVTSADPAQPLDTLA